jgi:hypothetical protein
MCFFMSACAVPFFARLAAVAALSPAVVLRPQEKEAAFRAEAVLLEIEVARPTPPPNRS